MARLRAKRRATTVSRAARSARREASELATASAARVATMDIMINMMRISTRVKPLKLRALLPMDQVPFSSVVCVRRSCEYLKYGTLRGISRGAGAVADLNGDGK